MNLFRNPGLICVAVGFGWVFFDLVDWIICLPYASLKKKIVLKLRHEAVRGVAEAAAADARESPTCRCGY